MSFVLPRNSSHQEETPVTSRSHSSDEPHLEVILDAPFINLRGSGVEVQPAYLSGHVVLHLVDTTSIKEVTLQFRGKARLPASTMNSESTSVSYVVCRHDWSFLEGVKGHSHTLKAGRHSFPFRLRIGGTLPSDLSTSAVGGASVAYKLCAEAIRTGFNSNLKASIPVSIVRSLPSESLGYQQTLEIGSTWAEKLMYTIMIPHKAWAAGDKFTALVKLTPLVKDVCVLGIKTILRESTKVSTQSNELESINTIASWEHDIVEGEAIASDGTPAVYPRPRLATALSPSIPASRPTFGVGSSSLPDVTPFLPSSEGGDDIVLALTVPLPSSVTPTHTLKPIVVSHQMQWSIQLLDPTGHTLEIRCALPLHLLNRCLIHEARSHTFTTRRLFFGEAETCQIDEEDMKLPTYEAHVRDRVANMYLPETATLRAINPWLNVASPTHTADSGASTPLEVQLLSQLPSAPNSGSGALDYVSCELLLSLSDSAPPALDMFSLENGSERESRRMTPSNSQSHSRAHSFDQHETPEDSNTPGNKSNWKIYDLLPRSMFRSHPGSHTLSRHPSLASQDKHRESSPLRVVNSSDGSDLLHKAYTQVPDYSIASRGFIGGIPPLSSMRGLPSYAEAEMSRPASRGPTDEVAQASQ